jgi:hypothetical protein
LAGAILSGRTRDVTGNERALGSSPAISLLVWKREDGTWKTAIAPLAAVLPYVSVARKDIAATLRT